MNDFFQQHASHFSFEKFVKQALKEDIGKGDITTLSTIPVGTYSQMQLLVKQNGIIAGIEAAQRILHFVYPQAIMEIFIQDGQEVKKNDIAFYIKGDMRRLLSYERLLLNIMQRMSGIATQTKYLQSLCYGTSAKVTDTRKTTPLFRFFEKWAVHIGGGYNHRWGLYDMILIKDNHIDAAGGIEKAIIKCRKYIERKKLNVKIEVETRNIDEVKKALPLMPDRIMLDNFTVENTKKAVDIIKGQTETEASGGINEHNIRDYALTGVNYISVGSLTHQINSLDLSLKIIK
ncbi:MAG: carboxylating nicotinate-nucleotide diphosphorylase [Bacteroidia bacterium]|nr:carboxylating nicotinate-nucleotide diphosphorylase [Bacteroidia bacterium]